MRLQRPLLLLLLLLLRRRPHCWGPRKCSARRAGRAPTPRTTTSWRAPSPTPSWTCPRRLKREPKRASGVVCAFGWLILVGSYFRSSRFVGRGSGWRLSSSGICIWDFFALWRFSAGLFWAFLFCGGCHGCIYKFASYMPYGGLSRSLYAMSNALLCRAHRRATNQNPSMKPSPFSLRATNKITNTCWRATCSCLRGTPAGTAAPSPRPTPAADTPRRAPTGTGRARFGWEATGPRAS